ncbi:MAG TPA: hypothetical protein DCS13_00895 [Candidatus Margulisbacteria bacterium]|nr:MAG: hypothetical protein A2X43_07835 [Candidatus Margulisbacteria bacterium GWD2_39_127]HAR62001.1 hypothetical protein [Candidatus Margulisiibacteriota bacterium]
MPEFATDGLDRNEIFKKLSKLDSYIKKAEIRLKQREKEQEQLYEKDTGDKEMIEKSLRKLNIFSRKRSLR